MTTVRMRSPRMSTTVDEIAEGIYRLSTFVPQIGPTGFTFNQFLLDDEEPLLFHTGHRSMFPSICDAIQRVMPVERLRWIAFGHVESDECGAMNELLEAAPHSQVAHGGLGCMVSLNEMADRPPHPLGQWTRPHHRRNRRTGHGSRDHVQKHLPRSRHRSRHAPTGRSCTE